MFDYSSLPSFDTFRGKLFWCGIFTVLAVNFAASATISLVSDRKTK